eukprot:c8567_g1_i3.p1 GENE.c8567_g1_i3~~c8567_g1_i3.p1  ORF type:complete len:365 (+),score=71.34 c8567_g1_i3:850-1944(+)
MAEGGRDEERESQRKRMRTSNEEPPHYSSSYPPQHECHSAHVTVFSPVRHSSSYDAMDITPQRPVLAPALAMRALNFNNLPRTPCDVTRSLPFEEDAGFLRTNSNEGIMDLPLRNDSPMRLQKAAIRAARKNSQCNLERCQVTVTPAQGENEPPPHMQTPDRRSLAPPQPYNFDEIAAAVRQTGIQLVAMDFDLTVINTHTNGAWAGTVDSLVSYVRPFVRSFIPACHSAGIRVAVVTFSEQSDLIKAVLERLFPDIASHVIIRSNNPNSTWNVPPCVPAIAKQPHIASAWHAYFAEKVDWQRILLVDDDICNITAMWQMDGRAIHFHPDESAFLDALVKKYLCTGQEVGDSYRTPQRPGTVRN